MIAALYVSIDWMNSNVTYRKDVHAPFLLDEIQWRARHGALNMEKSGQ